MAQPTALDILRELVAVEDLGLAVAHWEAASTDELAAMADEHARRHAAVWSKARALVGASNDRDWKAKPLCPIAPKMKPAA